MSLPKQERMIASLQDPANWVSAGFATTATTHSSTEELTLWAFYFKDSLSYLQTMQFHRLLMVSQGFPGGGITLPRKLRHLA
jgi:hypothetical protein